jgi:hypothetical protein
MTYWDMDFASELAHGRLEGTQKRGLIPLDFERVRSDYTLLA